MIVCAPALVSKVQRPLFCDQRDGHRPIVRADIQFGAARDLLVDRVLLVVEGNEALMEFLVGITVAGVDDPVALRAQDSAQVGLLVVAQGGHERTHRFLGGGEVALGFGRARRVPPARL